MRIALLGATGGIGGHLLAWALAAGHEVQALARRPGALAAGPAAGSLTVIQGDALDARAVATVIGGSDAVLSALGPRGARTPSLLAGAAANVVDGMAAAGVRRFIGVSAAGAFITGDPDAGVVIKAILPRIFATPFADVRQMEATIQASGLDWTLVRATRLVNGPGTSRYRVHPDYPPPRGRKIARADVAHFIEGALTGHEWLHGRPALGY
ncbi:MAG TPA: NAD(P)-binding oxidoreductase [Streptosporangiaceae bacterium]|nr:NAD(P)-binding oxidoreductase [Streptosporangiaceae bacterium]